MTTRLQERLEELAADVPTFVVPADLAAASWTRGRLRRIRRRVFSAVVAAGLVALVVALVPGYLGTPSASNPALGDTSPTVKGYPERIGPQWRTGQLPAHSGPLAGLVRINDDQARPENGVTWLAITESGIRYRIPLDTVRDVFPTISPDGRYLGYTEATSDHSFVLRDLVTGTKQVFVPYAVEEQWPTFWSPDGRRLLVAASSDDLVLGVDGSRRRIGRGNTEPDGFAVPVGWVDNDAIAQLHWSPWPGTPTSATVTITNLVNATSRSIALHPTQGWHKELPGQFAGSISPDGTKLAVLEGDSWATVHLFDLATGDETVEPVSISGVGEPCPIGWRGEQVTVGVYTSNQEANTMTVENGRPLLTIKPGLGTRCFIWAQSAIDGKAHGSFFGNNAAWWTWWWQEELIGLAIVAILALSMWRLRRRIRYEERASPS